MTITEITRTPGSAKKKVLRAISCRPRQVCCILPCSYSSAHAHTHAMQTDAIRASRGRCRHAFVAEVKSILQINSLTTIKIQVSHILAPRPKHPQQHPQWSAHSGAGGRQAAGEHGVYSLFQEGGGYVSSLCAYVLYMGVIARRHNRAGPRQCQGWRRILEDQPTVQVLRM